MRMFDFVAFRGVSGSIAIVLAIVFPLAGCDKSKRQALPRGGLFPRHKKMARVPKREKVRREQMKREMASREKKPATRRRTSVEYVDEAAVSVQEYTPPKLDVPPPKGDSVNLGVLDVESVGCDESIGPAVSDAVRETLFSSGHHQVMDRSDMSKILLEQDFQQSGRCDDMECIVKAGKILAVQKMVAGKVAMLGSTYRITLKLVDVESAKVDKIASESCTCPKDQLFLVAETAAKRLLLP